jgi:phage repressor protein C with HTH and peptisase S24 domain
MGKPIFPAYWFPNRSSLMTVGQRVAELLDATGLSQAELARRVNVDQSTINGLIRGSARSSRHLHKIARELGTTWEYLTGETNDPGPDAGKARAQPIADVPEESDDTVEVTALDVAYGMGGTYIDDAQVGSEKVKFSRSWLRHYTDAPPEMLFVAQGIGDSMWPTIHDTDTVIVDRSERVPRMADKIWAMAFGDVGMIKRLRPRPDGTMVILSDNPQVPEDRATDGELFIVGRVVAIVRKV